MPQAPNGILTEVGTNELEVVEFFIDERPFAINVAKVREIVRPQETMPVPDAHSCVTGVFRNREEVVPLIDLGCWLHAKTEPDPRKAKIIVAEFNATKTGFLVHGVSRIHRVSWADLETPAQGSMVESPSALGFIRLREVGSDKQRIVFLLDFERIVAEIRGVETVELEPVAESEAERRRSRVLLIAEDSPLIRKIMKQKLTAGGYRVVETCNGLEAWEKLADGLAVDGVVSDIEMPQMDGHHLTKRIKADERFKHLPVILYSSMIYEEMRLKGEAVGADAQICKPQLDDLLGTMDELIFATG